MRLLLAITTALSASAACIQVESDRIVASDLAKAVPELAAAPADTVFGFAPQPGVTRTITVAELRRFAAIRQVALTPVAPVCVEYAAGPLDTARLNEALKAGFGDPGAQIELVDFSRTDVPRGAIEFKRGDLALPLAPNPDPVLWRGRVRFGGQRTVAIWAKVRILVNRREVVAASGLRAGQQVTEGDIGVQNRLVPASAAQPVSDVTSVTGRIAARDIAPGAAIQAAWLRAPQAVKAGEEVSVRVQNGGAVLKLVAKATGPGRIGDSVMLVNPVNGKRFAAVMEGPAAAVVDIRGRVR